MRNKGQVNVEGTIGTLVLLLAIGIVISLGVGLNNDVSSSIGTDLTGQPLAVKNNATEKVNNAYQTASSLPTIYVAILMIGAVLGIIGFVRQAF